MTTTAPTIDQAVIRSIQTVLTDFGDAVRGSLTELRNEIGGERDARSRLESNIKLLAEAVERSQLEADSSASVDVTAAVDNVQVRLDAVEAKGDRGRQEISDRLDRMVGEQLATIETAVASAVTVLNRTLSERQQVIETAVERLDERLSNFDAQAARMVAYFTETTEALAKRIDERQGSIDQPREGAVDADQLAQFEARSDARTEELRKSMNEHINSAIAELNDRILAAQSIAGEGTNQSLADIDAYVGRVSGSLDEAIGTLSDRIAHLDRRLDALDARPTMARPSAPAPATIIAASDATAASGLFTI